MTPRPAQYLLRFDDLSPRMDRARFARFERWMAELGLEPILAVVPDNRDPELEVCPPDPGFWPWLGELEAAGAVIGLHGLHHTCQSPSGGLLPLHRVSEFAGVEEAGQRQMIRRGLEILRGHGLSPKLFVPPRHSFDRSTLRALKAEGLPALSDGFARRPFLLDGVACLPQQIWGPVAKPSGLWTFCIHAQTAGDEFVREMERFVREHRSQFPSPAALLAGPIRPLGPIERFRAAAALARVVASKRLKALRKF